MSLENTEKHPRRLLLIGLFFLATASFAKYFLPRWISLPETLADGTLGLLYGLAIGLMLLGLYFGSRQRSCTT